MTTTKSRNGFRAKAAERERARRYPVHTLVVHTDPDLEIVTMSYLIAVIAGVREQLGIAEDHAIKFIHSGPLRVEDWRELGLEKEKLTASELETRGYLFLDCGGGRFDSHGKGTDLSSLDLLVNECYGAIEHEKPQLLRVIEIVSANDRTGADIAPDGGTNARTPHTRRHLRKLVDGLNMLHPNHPETVLAYVQAAFQAIDLMATDAKMAALGMTSLLAWVDRELGDNNQTSPETLRKCLGHAGSVFLVDLVIDEMRGWPSSTDHLIEEFDRALDAEELEWTRAEADFSDREKTKVRRTKGSFPLKNGTAEEIALVVGRSDSPRFGEVARHKAKAEMVIQFYPNGKFLVYTKSLPLDKAVAAVRKLDLERRGIPVAEIKNAALDRVGHCVAKDASGRSVETLYFAEYRKAFGNAFRSNPLSSDCLVSGDELAGLISGCYPCQEADKAPAAKPARNDDRRGYHRGPRRGGHRR